MSSKNISRRQFLKTSGIIVTTAAFGAGTASLVIPSRAWAVDLQVFDAHQAKTLLGITRETYPHDTMADIYYAVVVRDLDAAAQADASVAQMLSEGIAELDQAVSIPWVDLSDSYRYKLLVERQDSPFFQKIRGTAVVSLYNNDLAWRYFGYEGPSFVKGGYIARGFNDLNWLPEPPPDASPSIRSKGSN